MGIRFLTKVLLFTPLLLVSCYEADIRGMFLSYNTVNERFDQSLSWNNENPIREIKTDTDSYLLFVMGDSHVGKTRNLETFLNKAKERGASAAVMAGDLTTGHPEDYDRFQEFIPDIDNQELPKILMAGNHDIYFNGWKEYYSRFGSSTYIVSVKTPVASDLIIVLDTAGGTLGDRQLRWLREVLKKDRPNFRNCFVFTHNNLFRMRFTPTTTPPVEELHELIDLFTRHNVNMVITGHDHIRSEKKFGNTHYITLDALVDGFRQAGYMELYVDSGVISYSFINF